MHALLTNYPRYLQLENIIFQSYYLITNFKNFFQIKELYKYSNLVFNASLIMTKIIGLFGSVTSFWKVKYTNMYLAMAVSSYDDNLFHKHKYCRMQMKLPSWITRQKINFPVLLKNTPL